MAQEKKQVHPAGFGYIPVASAITGREIVAAVTSEFAEGLAAVNGRALNQPDAELPLVFLVISGGTEAMICEWVAQRNESFGREPVLLLAHPGNNALAASLEALAHLRQKGHRGEILFFRNGRDAKALEQLQERIHFISAHRKLGKSRMGLIGRPSEWLVASTYDKVLFQSVWGVHVAAYELAHVFGESAGAMLQDAETPSVSGYASSEAFQRAYRVYQILAQFAARERLDALSLECFTLFLQYGTHGCFALSRLNDDGIAAGCEGDLASTLTLLWIRHLLGQSAWMANPVEIDVESRTLWLAHCTVPATLVSAFVEATHFETGCGVALAGQFAPGPVTVVRIGGARLDNIWLAEAEIVATGESPHRCRTQALLNFREASPLQELLKNPLGNHIVLTPGHHGDALRRWWELFIV